MNTGFIYKKTKTKMIIRPDNFGPIRKDIIILNSKDYMLGDRVEYIYEEKNGRRFAYNIKKIQ